MASHSDSDAASPTLEKSHRAWELAAFACLGVLYVLTAARALSGNDTGEFVVLAQNGGLAHPPGYPLYVAYLRALAGIPAVSAAHAAALATTLLGWTSAIIASSAARSWGATRASAVVAALLYGLHTTVWLVHSHAEVFGLNNLFAAAIVAASGPHFRWQGMRRGVLLGVLGGLALAHHHTIVLLAPVGILGLIRAAKESPRGWQAVAVAVMAATPGLSLYGLLFLEESCIDCLSWGEVGTFGDLVHHLLRRDFGTIALSTVGSYAPLDQLREWGQNAVMGNLGLSVVLFVLGVVAALRDPRAKRGALMCLASVMLAGPVLVLLFDVPPHGPQAEVVGKFHALSILLMTPFVALAVDWLRERAQSARVAWTMIAISCFAATLWGVATVASHHGPALEGYAADLLEPLPPRAIVIGTGDHRMFAVAHARHVLGIRRDVTYIDAYLLGHDWYARRAAELAGVELPPCSESIPVGEVVDALISSGRPVFATSGFHAEVTARPTYPVGVTIRLLPRGQAPPPPADLAAYNLRIYSAFRVQAAPTQTCEWVAELRPHYQRAWDTLARALAATGDEDGARRAREFEALYR